VVGLKNYHPWEITDWYAGVIIGFYEPLISRAYDHDCFSAMFVWGVSIIPMHTYFDKGFPLKTFVDWISLLLPIAIKVYDTYDASDRCVNQL